MTGTAALTGAGRWAGWLFGWVIPLAAVLAQVCLGLAGRTSPVVTALGFLGCYIISVLSHELAHFCAGKMLGLNPVLVSVGHGDLLNEVFICGVTWRFHALAFSGYVCPYPLNMTASRAARILMTAAGPLLNAFVAVACLFLMTDSEFERLHSAGAINFEALVLNLFMVNSYMFIRSMIPILQTPNDGQQIWNSIWRARRVAVSPTSTENRDDSTATSASWKAATQVFPLPNLLSICRHQIHASTSTQDEKLKNLDGFATAVLIYGATGYLAEADEYSRILVEAKPDDISALSTRGSILVEIGRVDDGMKVLESVCGREQSAFDRGLVAAFIALAHCKRGDLESARHWLDLARNADPDCIPLARIERSLNERFPSDAAVARAQG